MKILDKVRLGAIWFWALSYISIVFIFAFIYWDTWKNNPENFIVNNELNIQPREIVNKIGWVSLTGIQHQGFLDIINPSENINNFYQIAEQYEEQAEEMNADLRKHEESERLLRNKIMEMHQMILDQIDANYMRRIASISNELDEANSEWDEACSRAFAPEHINVEEYGEDCSEARIIYQQVFEKYIDEAGYQDTDFDGTELLSEELQVLKVENEEVKIKILELKRLLSDNYEELKFLYNNWREMRVGLLGFVDFLYYSVGISTTTTFGDIIASEKKTRLLVSIQLVLSFFILAGLVNSVRRK